MKCVLGATYEEVHDFLDRDRTRCLANQPGFSLLTVAGNIGCGGHGSSLKQGSLAALVRSISIAAVDGGGGVTSYERGDPGFDDALTHLGRIGPVVAIVLDVVDRFRISETRELVILGDDGADWRVDLQALVDSTIALQAQPDVHSCELWIAPYADSQGRMTAVLGTRKYAPITAPIDTPKNQRPPALRSKALQTIAQVAAAVTARIHPRAIRPVLRWALHSTTTNHGPVVMEPREGLDFGALNENRTTTIESGIDISTSTSVAPLVDLFETLDTMGDAENLYLFSPIGVRFVGQGEKGGLSPQAGRARSMHVEISTFADDQWFHGSKILPRLQKLLAQAGGRPHWGLNVFLSSTELRALWPDAAWDGLKAMVAQTDQSGVFANPLLDPIVPIP
ncbi:D-arabinono-1,4-lactone oxidase [soil metagenome]